MKKDKCLLLVRFLCAPGLLFSLSVWERCADTTFVCIESSVHVVRLQVSKCRPNYGWVEAFTVLNQGQGQAQAVVAWAWWRLRGSQPCSLVVWQWFQVPQRAPSVMGCLEPLRSWVERFCGFVQHCVLFWKKITEPLLQFLDVREEGTHHFICLCSCLLWRCWAVSCQWASSVCASVSWLKFSDFTARVAQPRQRGSREDPLLPCPGAGGVVSVCANY